MTVSLPPSVVARTVPRTRAPAPEAMVPYLVATVRRAWDDLAVRQQTQVYGFLQHLYATHPQLDEVAAFLQEVAL